MYCYFFSQLDEIDEKELPFIQSTPRASFGQRLLSCEELLNLSNLTSTDLAATNHNNDSTGNNIHINQEDKTLKISILVGINKQMLEEEVKRLEHQLKQVLAETDMMKSQIASMEEQNESLQVELSRCKTRLAKFVKRNNSMASFALYTFSVNNK